MDQNTALGGHREVGRSATLISTNNSKVLVDCGMININDPEHPWEEAPYLYAPEITEKNDVVYKSKNSGFMHACGHDCHIAMALDIARYFSANRDFNGIVRVFFQPAEESPPGGAVKMIQEGVLEDVDYIIGQHVGSDIPSGKIGYRAGPSNANADSFRIKIKGRGGHGSAPHKSVDAIYIAAEFITLAQTIVSRKVDPVKAAVVTFGTIHGGYRHNIIGDEVEMTGTARTQDMETRALVKSELKNILEGLCKLTHSEFDFEYEEGYPVMVNDPEITEKIASVMNSAAMYIASTLL